MALCGAFFHFLSVHRLLSRMMADAKYGNDGSNGTYFPLLPFIPIVSYGLLALTCRLSSLTNVVPDGGTIDDTRT
jgi:hypothetical protein